MPRHRGFTLIELLITIMIIGLLASMLLFGMLKVQSQTQAARTKSTIAKVDGLFRPRWESIAARRLPVNTIGLSPKDAAELRLVALRQIQRMEIPDHWSEVTTAPAELKKINNSSFSPAVTLSRTALSEAYLLYYNTVANNKPGAVSDLNDTPAPNSATGKPSTLYQDAECLYMILTVGVAEDRTGREMFLDAEVGDLDGDGANEFLDGWGMPIRLCRWPVGFVDDPRQEQDTNSNKRFGHLSDVMPPKVLATGKPDATSRHDSFDPRRVDAEAFSIYPLINSAGPDRIDDIARGSTTQVRDDPYADVRADSAPTATYDPLATFTYGTPSVGLPKWVGLPHDLTSVRKSGANAPVNGVLNHYDNIHNHQLDTSMR
jgi:prepilin-type N-terminal cleavage/methylation domain-containing protein